MSNMSDMQSLFSARHEGSTVSAPNSPEADSRCLHEGARLIYKSYCISAHLRSADCNLAGPSMHEDSHRMRALLHSPQNPHHLRHQLSPPDVQVIHLEK